MCDVYLHLIISMRVLTSLKKEKTTCRPTVQLHVAVLNVFVLTAVLLAVSRRVRIVYYAYVLCCIGFCLVLCWVYCVAQ
jgi:hypothetical protein